MLNSNVKENCLFTYKSRDIQADCPIFSYSHVTLKVPIKDFPVGTYFEVADIDYEMYTIEFFEKYEGEVEGVKVALFCNCCNSVN